MKGVITFLVCVLALPLFPGVSRALPIAELQLIGPPRTYDLLDDFVPFLGTGIGDVTAKVQDRVAQGCLASDFSGFTAGNIALIERGSCAFTSKALHAIAAGASGVIVYDDVFHHDPLGALALTEVVSIPVIFSTRDVGLELLFMLDGAVEPLMHIITRTSEPSFAQVPEPSTILLLGSSLVGLAIRRRKLINNKRNGA